nr:unnamed protein product [Digitaria exilis]
MVQRRLRPAAAMVAECRLRLPGGFRVESTLIAPPHRMPNGSVTTGVLLPRRAQTAQRLEASAPAPAVTAPAEPSFRTNASRNGSSQTQLQLRRSMEPNLHAGLVNSAARRSRPASCR